MVIASGVPDIVTALSVELGSISLATCIDAPVDSLISLILEPALPISEPHWLAGTISRNVTGGLGAPPGVLLFGLVDKSNSNLFVISENAALIDSGEPVMVTILS